MRMKKLLTLLLAFMATTATLFADSGTCGANVNWDLTGGVLTISGTGYMTSYTSPSSRPWHSFASSITSVVIEEGVMSIGESAFEDFSSLTSVTIPNSLEVIEGYAFFGCSALSSVTIPDNIMAIGNSTFKYCSALTTITIPANVNYIKYQAFSGCTGLTEIICEATTPPTCEDLVFEEVTNTIPVYVPAGSVAAYKAASGWNYFENIQAKSKEIYAALSGSTMTIYFDDQKASRPGVLDKWTPGMGVDMDDATRNSITRAVISPSMVDALPTGTKWWFFNLANLTTIEGLAYLNTSEVENMQAMFMRCSSLTSLDLSSFNTDNVTNMTNMFSGCSALTSLDVSGFNTDNVTNMTNMFSGCSSLSSLDLSSFNTAKVTDMSYMFRGCESLKTIYCNDAWNPSSSGYMFYGCTALVGGEGTKYDDSKTDATYARPDGLGGQPGYFTVRGVTWNLTDGVLTILGKGPMEEYASKNDVPWYTDRKSVVSVIIKDGVTVIGKNAFFDCINMTSAQIGKGVTKINNYAFRNCGSLTAVTIPSAVASLGKQAFSGCTGLTELTCEAITPPTCGDNVFEGVTNTIPVYVPAESVSAYKSADGWNYFENIQAKGAGTKEIYAAMVDGSKMVLYYDDQKSSRANVIEGWTPKYGTSGMEYKQEIAITLAELDASMQDARPTSTYLWFGRLENMTDIVHLDYLNTSEVMDMNFMFMVCNSLTSLDLHNFNTSSVVDMNGMFSSCSALTSLDVSGFNTSSVVGMNGMFSSCSALTSLDVSSFNTSSVVDMNNMFSGCSALTSLDVSGFNTSSVMDMGTMFYGCSSLTELDLSSFNTSSVTEMSIMFYDCSALKTIYCDDAWNPSSSDDMFGGCTALVGGKGTKYDDSKTDKTYARPDGLDSKPGYFTANTYTGEALIDGINYFLDGSDLTAQVLDLSGDKYVGDIVVPEKATYINDYTVTSINSEAFTNSPELLSVSLPKTVNWIEPGSFLRNPKLTAINVAPANTTYSSLDGVLFNTVQTELIAYPTGRAGAYVVPDGVESILDEAFTDNANLTAITLPASLIEIASLAFDECTGLTSITSKAVNAPAAGSDAFQKVSKSIPVYVPEKGLASYKAEYEWKDFTNFITIEDKAAADAVIVKIDAIGAVAYTTECKDRIDAARNAYDALTAEQKALVPAEKLAILTAAEKAYADLKAQAEADQAAADIVIGQINAIGTVTLSSEPAIVAARQAYDALTDAQKALVTNYAVLTAAEVKLEILKKQAESDAAAAAAVSDLINGIGTVTYTTDCKERIDAAREAYNALTDAQKALVTNLGTLTAAEKAYADLKAKAEADQAAADIVIGKINAIGVVSYSEASKALIDDARAAYDALTDAQKALIPAATYKVLTDAEQAYADLKAKTAADLAAANIVITKIDAIGSVTLSSEPAIVDARAAYNALTTDQKALVTNYATLVAAEKALADLKAKAAADQAAADNVIAQINAIGTVTLSSEPAIVAARAAYNALTADQKALVTNLSTLTAAEAKLDQLKKQAAADQAAADLVIGKINAIGTVSYSEASKALIDAARTAYDALTAAQQALVTNYGTLTAAEKAYADLKAKAEADQAAANTVIAQINAIGEVTLSSEPAIVAARSAYNALTADQKALVSNYSVLTAAEAKLEVLKQQAEADQAAATAVIGKINAIGTVAYDEASKARIDDARHAYDALTAAQKALVTNLDVLLAAEQAYADLKAQAEVIAAAKQQLVDLVSEATALKAVAAMYAPSAVGEIEAIIASAQATINDPNATLEEINMKYNNLQYDFELEANKLLEEAKEQLKQSIRALYLPGDYPSWYASAIIPALDQVDAITWDFSKTVQENILLFQATGEALYNNAKKALEDLRAKDTRELVSSCTFTGFADAIQLDMTWNKSALNNLINTLNASVAAEPYRLDAEMSSLGKWDPVNKELIILDPYEAQKLTAGDYQFITAVKIDGEDAKQYRLPKATEEVLSVTVDAAVWSVDLSGIVIDANYSFTYVTSPMFTISKSEDVELVNEDPIKTQKIFHNGHFYILRGEHIYDLRGTRVK